MKGLDAEEVNVLELLAQAGSAPDGTRSRQPSLPRRLLEFGYVAWNLDGTSYSLTKAGERALFHIHCVDALAEMATGRRVEAGTPVCKWLEGNGFIIASDQVDAQQFRVTPRGHLWLESLNEGPLPPPPPVQARDFARRRSS